MSAELLDSLRHGRSSGSVLKIRVSQVRSKHPSHPIFVFEGDEDIGPYEVWLRGCFGRAYQPVPGKGKGQLLSCRDSLLSDKTGSFECVYFFVDRDFDGLRERPPGDDIYVTGCYSVENEMLVPEVLHSLLVDEFKLFVGGEEIDRLAAHAERVLESICVALTAANKRIFVARRLGVPLQIDDSVTKYIALDANGASVRHTEEQLERLVKYERPVPSELWAAMDAAFENLEPRVDYRGKFLLRGLANWFRLLAELRESGANNFFSDPLSIRFSPEHLSLRALASRRKAPDSLVRFVSKIGHPSAI